MSDAQTLFVVRTNLDDHPDTMIKREGFIDEGMVYVAGQRPFPKQTPLAIWFEDLKDAKSLILLRAEDKIQKMQGHLEYLLSKEPEQDDKIVSAKKQLGVLLKSRSEISAI